MLLDYRMVLIFTVLIIIITVLIISCLLKIRGENVPDFFKDISMTLTIALTVLLSVNQ